MNKKYEGMFILKADMIEADRKAVFTQIADVVSKNKGEVSEGLVWSEKRKLCFPIKKQQDGMYYLVNFSAPATAIKELRNAYNLNENILRVLITG